MSPRRMSPPSGSMRFGDADVVSITSAPDGRFYVARSGASTVLVDGDDLVRFTVVVEAT